MAILALVLMSFLGPNPMQLVTSHSTLDIVEGRGELLLIYRNSSSLTLSQLAMRIDSATALQFKIRPERIGRCAPAERCVFSVQALSGPDTPAKKFWVDALLSAEGHPQLMRTRLQVDASPSAGQSDAGWMDAGRIQVVNRSQSSRVVALSLLSVVPIALLLGLGWVLKKRAHKKAQT